jgi:integrase/recombinase XerD
MPYQYRREPLTPDQATRLANACTTPQERLVVWTLLDTGLRLRELSSLTRDAIDWQGQRVRVHGKGGPYGTRSKVRVIPLTARVRALLEPHFALHDTFDVHAKTIQRIVRRVANRAALGRMPNGKAITAHTLRHTFAVTAVQKGISLPALQRILGHDHLETTSIYLNLSPEHVLDEFKAKW